MENNKVVLPAEVSQAIVNLRGMGWKNENLLNIDMLRQGIKAHPYNYCHVIHDYLQNNGLENYFTAIINGYEVEETPEQRLINLILNPQYNLQATREANYKKAIYDCLRALGIQIEGVNK